MSYSRNESRTSFKRSLRGMRDRAALVGESVGGYLASPAALLVILRMFLWENPSEI